MATGVIAQTASTDDWNRSIATLVPSPNDAESQRTVDEFRGWLQSLLADDPTQRPNDAKLVADQLSRWTESELDEANQDLTFKRSHGGTRPLLWDRLQSRRAWLGHAIGLGATAAASSWAGHSLASTRPKKEPVFSPGFEAHNVQRFRAAVDLLPSNLQFLRKVRWDDADESHTADMLSPIQADRWSWITFQPIEFPFVPQAGLLYFVLLYDCDPGKARYRAEYRSSDDDEWTPLANGWNFYGGRYERPVELILTPRLLKSTKSFHLRIGIMFDRPASYPTESPPIGIFAHRDDSLYEAGSMLLWENLFTNSDSAGVRPGS